MKAMTAAYLTRYKVGIAVKSLHNFANPRADDPQVFKEEVKVKYYSTLAIVGKFLNGTVLLKQLLKEDTPSETWNEYCAMTPAEQLAWK